MSEMEREIVYALMIAVSTIVGIRIMEKIEPDNKWYPVYASAICISYLLIRIGYLIL